MANTTIQLKRSSVAGKQPNTSTLSIGELALNLTDKKLYSSDGSNIFEPASNVSSLYVGNSSVKVTINSSSFSGTSNNSLYLGGVVASSYVNTSGNYTIAGNLNFTATNTYFTTNIYAKAQIVIDPLGDIIFSNGSGIQANGTWGSSGQALTSDGSGNMYWSTIVNTDYQYSWANTQTFQNTISFSSNVNITNRVTANAISTTYVIANGSIGSNGRVLTSNGAGVYWAVPSGGGGGFDPDAQYIFTNTTTMSNTLVITKLSANGTLGGLNQVLTSDGAYAFWKDVPGAFPIGDYGTFGSAPVDAFGVSTLTLFDCHASGSISQVDLNYPVAATM